MRIENEIKLDFKDVLFRPRSSKLVSRKDVDLTCTYTFKHSGRTWTGVPIMASNMDGVGTIKMAEALSQHQMFTCLVKSYNQNDFDGITKIDENNFAVSTGIGRQDFDNLSDIINRYPTVRTICIDVANGYSEIFCKYVAEVRKAFPNCTIIAGNVVTSEMAQQLILRGADIIKVGLGSGSVCTTRIQTGVGYPQLSAIIECAEAAHGLGGHVIADGGCVCPGDVAKAFGAGADFVMLGSMLAGHDEGQGEIISENGDNPRVIFYGMSSDTAMMKHHKGVAEYRSSEGRTVSIPYRGAVKNTLKDITGGLRSTCTYVGAPTLAELSNHTTFIRVTKQFNDVFVR